MNTRREAESCSTPSERLLRVAALPHVLFNVVFTSIFLFTVGRLFILRRGHPGVLMLFLFPPLMALAARNSSRSLPSTRMLGSGFLILISFGDLFALLGFEWGKRWFGEVSPHQSQELAWYVTMYFLFLVVIWPPFLFIRPLLQRRRGEEPYFSPLTCYLGLGTWTFILLALSAIAVGALVGQSAT